MNEQKKGLTMEEQKKFDEKKKRAADDYKKRKDEAREIIMNYMNSPESKKIPEEVRTSILYLSGKGVRSERSGISSELKSLLLKGPLSLMEIFEKFEYGIPSMEQRIRGFINVTHVEDRIWVDFDKKTKIYSVVETGENPPKDWNGYLPKVKVVEETL